MPSLPGLMGDVYFGDVETPLPPWTAADADEDVDDDAPTEEERAAVASMLGFDPAELDGE